MSNQFDYVSIDTIIAKFQRDTKETNISELDLIEWTGEALSFLKVPQIQEQKVTFLEVKAFEACLPKGFQMVLQIARNNKWIEVCPSSGTSEEEGVPDMSVDPLTGYPVPLAPDGSPLSDYEVAYYRPFSDLQWEYQPWTNSQYYLDNFSPVRLANHTFFASLVCKEKSPYTQTCTDEYTIVGITEKKLRFSFEEGQIALAYLKNAVDEETGYPLIPDNISFITAITYYIKWKIIEWHQWQGRRGFDTIGTDTERKWLKYAKQAKNYAKMPKSIDEFQNRLEQSHYLIPRGRTYYGYFGNLGREEKIRRTF